MVTWRSFDLCVGIVGIVFEPIVVIYVGFPFSKKDRIFVFPHFRNSREKSMRRKLVPIPFTIFGEHGMMVMTMMAKPVKALELHYPITQFLIIIY